MSLLFLAHSERSQMIIAVFIPDNKSIESLSTGVFEPRTVAGNGTFSSVALIVSFLFINSSCKCYNESFLTYIWTLKFAKTLNIRLPVAVRGSKTSVLKLSNIPFQPRSVPV